MIDVNAQDFSLASITLQMLIDDAVERDDKEALRWLEDNATSTIKRKIDKEKEMTEDNCVEVTKPITMYRVEYLTKYCGYVEKKYVPSEEAKARAKERAKAKAKKARADMFANAFAKLAK